MLEVLPALQQTAFDERVAFDVALNHLPPPRPCGVRVVISDFLLEATPGTLVERFSRGAAQLKLIQVLDAEDLEPSFVGGTRLTDAETGEALDRTLTAADLERYEVRFRALVAMWRSAVARVHGGMIQVSAGETLKELMRGELGALVEVE